MGWLFLGLFNMHPLIPKRGFLTCNNWLEAMIPGFPINYSPWSNSFHSTTAYLDTKKTIGKPGIFFNACNVDPPQSFLIITFSPHPAGNKLTDVKEHISLSSAWPARGALCPAGAAENQLGIEHGIYTPLVLLLLPLKQRLRHDSLFQENKGMIQRYCIQWKPTSANRQITHDTSHVFFITPSIK